MTQQIKPVKVSYCYAREDEALLKELDSHLGALKRSGRITSWYDREILPGTEWGREIDKHLGDSDIILLLISSSFMGSEYCYGIEMQQAFERYEAGEAHIIPIILRPVEWKVSPLGKLQALPTNGKPVTSWHNRDEAFQDIIKGILRVVDQLDLDYRRKGRLLLKAKEYKEALIVSEQALHRHPKDAYLHFNRAGALFGLSRYDEALVEYEQAIQLKPEQPWFHRGKGLTLLNLERHEEALKAFEQAIRLGMDIAAIYDEKGDVHFHLGQYEEALAAYSKALELAPDEAAIHRSKGHALFHLGKYEQALTAHERAIELEPTYAIGYSAKGQALNNLERFKEARQAYTRAQDLGYSVNNPYIDRPGEPQLVARFRYTPHQDDYWDAKRALESLGFRILGFGKELGLGSSWSEGKFSGEGAPIYYNVLDPPGWHRKVINNGDVVEIYDENGHVQIKQFREPAEGRSSFFGVHLVVRGWG